METLLTADGKLDRKAIMALAQRLRRDSPEESWGDCLRFAWETAREERSALP